MAKLSRKIEKNVSRNYQTALKYYESGTLPKAEEFCNKVLSTTPGHAEALHLLARIALKVGKNDIALQLAGQAASRNPKEPTYCNTMGAAYYGLGHLQDAIKLFQKALTLQEPYPEAHSNLCVALKDTGNLVEAEKHCRRAIELQPQFANAYANLAQVFAAQEIWDMSIFYFLKSLELQPDQPQILYKLGLALGNVGRNEEAVEHLRRAVEIQPDFAEAHNYLAKFLYRCRIYSEAMHHFRRSLELKDDPAVHFNFAVFLQFMGKLDLSKYHYLKVLETNPNVVEANSNLIHILLAEGLHREAYKYIHEVMKFDPIYLGFNDCLLMHYLYDADMPPEEIDGAHRQWGERVAAKISVPERNFENDRNPWRPLRVGFVSGDFREHAVMRFLKDVFLNFDPEKVELYCFSNNNYTDYITKWLQENVAGWWDIKGLSDEKVAELIQEEGIDILVDLAGHTGDNRLLVFARRPAPIQVTWLGYPCTTGLAAMDYRLTDVIADPPESIDWHSEELVRLEEGFLSFSEPFASPEPAGPPCKDNEYVTFGCFNNNAKITPPVISLWAELLEKMPNSRLFLKNDALRSPAVKNIWQERFQEHNVELDRIELVPRVDHYADHLALYGKVDIGLDVFPYNGTTTTCEAMWMGVPVVVLRGSRHVGRVGASLLTRVGMEELIAETPEDYVEKALRLAWDREKIIALRRELRKRMRGSALGDGRRFVGILENTFRDMWLRWLDATK